MQFDIRGVRFGSASASSAAGGVTGVGAAKLVHEVRDNAVEVLILHVV